MGAYDSVQVVDLIGIDILNTLGVLSTRSRWGFFRMTELSSSRLVTDPKTSKIHKKIIRAFNFLELRIEIVSNLKIVNFLDVPLDLDDSTFNPFSKSNLTPHHLHT